ncbi:hypothetical protein IEO21_05571 [Rhodonia placenta]|uniref:Uncharacterized protein n=1 Tax=Rhodonia placenta TaxID=104341 RepID=A0A8H7P1V7_9APHY|nr:hypothetical protein IEO21_05571 [Postia placenta]
MSGQQCLPYLGPEDVMAPRVVMVAPRLHLAQQTIAQFDLLPLTLGFWTPQATQLHADRPPNVYVRCLSGRIQLVFAFPYATCHCLRTCILLAAFRREKIRKLHIDRFTSNGDQESAGDTEENELLQRLVLLFGEHTPDDNVESVVGEAHDWLSTREDNLSAHRALRSAVAALQRHKELQQESREAKEAIDSLLQKHRRQMRAKEQELHTTRTIEDNLVKRMSEMEHELQASLQEAEAELAQLRGHQEVQYDTSSSLKQPDSASPGSSRYQDAPNPLPQPPQPITPERLASFSRSYAPASAEPSSSAASTTTHNSGRVSFDQVRASATSLTESSSEHREDLRRDKTLKAPLLIPGAPPTQKVIPPRPPKEQDRSREERGLPRSISSGSVNTVPPPSLSGSHAGTSGSSIIQTTYGYQYGFIPGQGYVWYQVPWPPATGPSTSAVAYAGIGNANAQPSASNDSLSRHAPNTTPATQNPLAREGARTDSRSASTRSGHAQNGASPNGVQSAGTSQPPPGNSNTSTLSNTSLSHMTLLSAPQSARSGSHDQRSASQRDILSILNMPVEPQQSESSPAPTWGTVHSSQIPSRTSANSSLGDLGLFGLPPMDISAEDDEPPEEEGSSSSEDEVLDEDNLMTPRRRPLTHGRSVVSEEPRAIQPTPGLMLHAYAAPPRQVISGPQELQIVSQSLMQYASQQQREPHAHNHSARTTPGPNTEYVGTSDTIFGSRTGIPLYSSRPQSRRGEEDRPQRGPVLPSRTHSDSYGLYDRGSISDSEHVYPRHSGHRRHSSMSAQARPFAAPPQTSALRQHSAASRAISDRAAQTVRFQSPVEAPSRERRHRDAHRHVTPASAIDENGFVPALGQSSLLLSFSSGPASTSSAVNGRARPGSRSDGLFGLLGSRGRR